MQINIVYPTNPLGNKIGGVETFIKGCIKYAPPESKILFVGISSGSNPVSVRKWNKITVHGKEVDFFPVLFVKDENEKSFVPLSLKFTVLLAFLGLNLSGGVMLFNRIEPSILFIHKRSPKLGFIHNDILQHIDRTKSELLWGKMPQLYKWFEEGVFGSFSHIFTSSRCSYEYYRKRYVDLKNKFSFMNVWYDSETFYPASDKKSLRDKTQSFFGNGSANKKRVLFVGRLQAQKAPQRAVESHCEYLKTRGDRDSILAVVGVGNLQQEMMRIAEKYGMKENLIFLGELKQEALADLYRSSDALLVTSNFEAGPRCVIEALGCGLPVVTTDVGEVRQVVKSGLSGEVVAGTDAKEIAGAIDKVLNCAGVYSNESCLNLVEEFTPKKILAPIYQRIRVLSGQEAIDQ